MRAETIRLRPDALSQWEARSQLVSPGDVCLVVRQRLRSVVMRCPDDCGDDITLNADPLGGPAWSVYRIDGRLTIYPSIWRTEGCRSHFIVWRSRISWVGEGWSGYAADELTIGAVLLSLSDVPIGYWELADALGILPWDCLAACRQLVRTGFAHEYPPDSGRFARK